MKKAPWANYKDGSGKYLGLGITNNDAYSGDTNEGKSPEHSIDNEQRYDMALLTFSEMVKLTDLKLGWTTNDSDVTVMAYKGSGKPTLIGKTFSELVGLGWDSIGNYSDVGTTTKSINDKGVFFFLLADWRLQPSRQSGRWRGDQERRKTYDYIKLASVSGCSAKEARLYPAKQRRARTGLLVQGQVVEVS